MLLYLKRRKTNNARNQHEAGSVLYDGFLLSFVSDSEEGMPYVSPKHQQTLMRLQNITTLMTELL
jgi:hypothetical protein